MPLQYVNRKGDTYYLLVGKTKTGKPKFSMSKTPKGVLAEEVPEGYEIHENPVEGLVSVRKIRPTRLLSSERDQVCQAVRQLAGQERFIVDIDGDSLVVYLPDTIGDLASSFERLLGGFPGKRTEVMTFIASNCRYSAMMRFTLVDSDRRLFNADRWCFRGSIDDWHSLEWYQPLSKLLETYSPHLGQESFFEL